MAMWVRVAEGGMVNIDKIDAIYPGKRGVMVRIGAFEYMLSAPMEKTGGEAWCDALYEMLPKPGPNFCVPGSGPRPIPADEHEDDDE